MRERRGPGEIVLQRRHTQRIPLCVEITYQIDGETLPASTANLTSAGCFVETEIPVPNDALIDLALHLSDDSEPAKVSGHVVRVQRRQDDQPGFAVEFDCIDKETCERIDDLIERAAAPRGFDEDYCD
jgi:c-di-GMP-binding flagellar brake protein YcgR